LIIAIIVFLFVLYCILEACKFNKLSYEMISDKDKEKLKRNKTLSRPIVYTKMGVYVLLYLTVIINHFSDPLSRSGGAKSFLVLVIAMTFFLIVCITDVVKVRKSNEKK
jgi:hypothetical protein